MHWGHEISYCLPIVDKPLKTLSARVSSSRLSSLCPSRVASRRLSSFRRRSAYDDGRIHGVKRTDARPTRTPVSYPSVVARQRNESNRTQRFRLIKQLHEHDDESQPNRRVANQEKHTKEGREYAPRGGAVEVLWTRAARHPDVTRRGAGGGRHSLGRRSRRGSRDVDGARERACRGEHFKRLSCA